MKLIPIKIKITRGTDPAGKLQNLYPPFNEMPPEKRGNMDWSYYVDKEGIGWHYDKKSGFGEIDVVNPDPTVMYGCVAMPVDFATEALQRWPNLVTRLTEAEFAAFYDDRAHAHEETEKLDAQVLQAIHARVQLEAAGIAPPPSKEILARRKECLDPEHARSGIRRNKRKTWKQFKAHTKITIVE
jgi:hypothetical protein